MNLTRYLWTRVAAVAVGALLYTLPPWAVAQEGAALARQHGEWLSGVLLGPQPVRFRALGEQLDGTSYVSLAVDLLEGDCRKRFVTINVHLPEPLSGDFLSEGLEGAVRVDRHPVRKVEYRAGTQSGRRILFIYLMEIDGEDAFWKEMAAGEWVRFRFPTERKDYLVRFPLQGYAQAQQRATTLCRTPGADTDRLYFPK